LALELRKVAKLNHVPIVTAVQINREGLKQKDTYESHHIALSQFISNHADLIISLRNKDVNQTFISGISEIEAKIVKHRDGPKKKFNMRANFEIMKIEEIENSIDSFINVDTSNSDTELKDVEEIL
jgi:replicative DNA helicase